MTRLDSRGQLLLMLSTPLNRTQYLGYGFLLIGLKYLVETILVRVVTGKFFSIFEFFNPVLTTRIEDFADYPILAWGIFLWSLPFLGLALNLSVRRAIDSDGISPWMSLLILVPGLNVVLVIVLALTPSDPRRAYPNEFADDQDDLIHHETSVVTAIVVGLGIGAMMMAVSVLYLKTYGSGLFVATPIVMGATTSFFYNRRKLRSLGASVGIGGLVIVIGSVALLLFALEGAVCIVMALPLIVPLGVIGGLIGMLIAQVAIEDDQFPHISAVVICLPIFAGIETYLNQSRETVVMTSIEIDAPPEKVWESVVAFPDIDSPPPWYFHLGIATPLRARIEGHGPGAIRYCEFTTGTFVEPITQWDRPRRLAFQVTEQPDPLIEMSPIGHIHPPHLDGYMQSNRGEFRLIELPNGRTRLEGRTWYELKMFPQAFWMLWSDAIVHRIHQRVLEHIRDQAEPA
ncbi:SRPBCC family protein [Bremerella cremea]|uniref:SRPBCC family protein n=1 Tax=Bremerella cremea TaxID=1031537 RepID=UPI0031F15B32